MSGHLSADELHDLIAHDAVDTVVLAIPDMQGKLQGKRFDARHFAEDVLTSGSQACAYLLTVDVDMQIVGGFEMSGWDSGLGDFTLVPDLGTLRTIPWQEGTALAIADAVWPHGRPVPQSPRQILKTQLERLSAHGWTALAATELEFLLFDNSYEEAHARHYADLTPASPFNIDYSILGTSKVEPLLRDIRRGMRDAGMSVEGVKGECNPGQFELGFKYTDALTTCDNHTIYKLGAKEIAAQHGVSITFMAKYNQREGNSCHVHFSLIDPEGAPVFPGTSDRGFSPIFEHFLAGLVAATKDVTLFMAPNINSYKRFQAGSFAPTVLRWGLDNRTCAIRVVGEGAGLRFEHRAPGADANPYLAVAAIIAAGLHGLENELELGEPFVGNAYEIGGDRMPTTLGEAARLWRESAVARAAFGDLVVDHYANAAEKEVAAFDLAVTDWERLRGFERM